MDYFYILSLEVFAKGFAEYFKTSAFLPLTLLLAVFGLTAAYPLGVILALGRQSSMSGVRRLCVVYIELIRGVPLISLLISACMEVSYAGYEKRIL